MKAGNLASGASKLALAVKQLDIKWQAAEETWRDQTAKQFHRGLRGVCRAFQTQARRASRFRGGPD